jgi:MlrC C-terminus
MRIGGKISPMSGDPLDADCVVKALIRDMPMTALTGSPTSVGDSALVEVGGVDCVLMRAQALNVDVFTRLGCELTSNHRRDVRAALLRVVLSTIEARAVRRGTGLGNAQMASNDIPGGKASERQSFRSGRSPEFEQAKRPRSRSGLRTSPRTPGKGSMPRTRSARAANHTGLGSNPRGNRHGSVAPGSSVRQAAIKARQAANLRPAAAPKA